MESRHGDPPDGGTRFGVEIRSVEMIGLIPESVRIGAAEYYMQIRNFDHADILERSIQAHLDERMTS